MFRTLLVMLTILAAAVAGPLAQRNRDFGLSQDAWCRDVDRADVCEVRDETLRDTRTIDVDARQNGGVSVRGWDRSDVHVRARVVVWADSEAEARSIASAIKLVTTDGRIRADGPTRESRGRSWRDRHWSVAFELEVPRNAELSVTATNGGVNVSDVRGRLDLRTVNGGIVLDDVGGNIRGETTNGGVQVRIRGQKWDGSGLDVRTVNGGITLALPENLSAELEARTVNGGLRIDYPLTVSGLVSNRREIRGTIGNGGPPIRASAVNGGIPISRP